MKKQNKLNVFTHGFVSWTYLHNWCHNIKQIFRNIKYAWQRITKGYCNRDLWDLDNFYTQIFVDTLEDFANNLNGCPNSFYDSADEEGSMKKWREYLTTMRQYFYNSMESNEVYKNNINANFSSYMDNERHYYYSDTSEEAENLRNEYIIVEEENAEKRNEDLKKALTMLKDVYRDLWD